MATGVERRQSTRLTIPSQVGGPRGQLQAVRLLELSTAGARIEHLRPVPDWKLCVLTLPPALAGIRLQGEVRWSRVIGR